MNGKSISFEDKKTKTKMTFIKTKNYLIYTA